MKYWRALKVAWQTFWFAVRHERAHEQWQQSHNRACDHRITGLLGAASEQAAKDLSVVRRGTKGETR